MKQDTYMKVSGLIFAVVGVMHALRLLNGWDVVLGTFSVPTGASVVGLVVAGYLAYTGLKK